MVNEIQRQIYGLMPEAVAIVSICALVVVVWNVSRWITIHHYLKHHMESMVASEMKEKESYIEMMEEENEKMLKELKSSRIKLKIIRNAMIDNE
ncbi:hypothetical protein [Oceanispirochaeta sp.]|uniref:hypothetical protein n=1 Tax=Oceanispirochaeta sp. TaxID=2035350 RepID=UPI0026174EC4|nr:hypothetical protein [Oceanispirochaeta sp.]MDA3957336.1 hypothetical protein [Oceanispirochaeta sp.]